MKTIKKLTNNPAILELTEIVETKLGNKIHLGILDCKARERTICSVHWDRKTDGFCLLYIPESPPPDVIICHELVHIILSIEGFPGMLMPRHWENIDPWYPDMVSYAFNTALHLEVWPLGERLGFCESERFDDDIKNKLIPDIEYFALAGHHTDDKTITKIFYHLLAALLSPAPEAIKSQLLQVSERSMPMLFAPVQELCKICKAALPLNAETFFDISEMLLAPLNVHQQGGILPDYPVARLDPNFRKFVLQNYSYSRLENDL